MSEAGEAQQRLVSATQGVSNLRQAIQSQNLRLDPAAGQRIRSSLDGHLSTVDAWLSRAGNLARQAPFGANPVATAMAEKFKSRADGDQDSFVAVLRKYRQVLEEARDAVGAAMQTYDESDHSAADRLRTI